MADTSTKVEDGPAEIKGAGEKDPVLLEINKKIEENFDIFDHESNKTVDVRYVCVQTDVYNVSVCIDTHTHVHPPPYMYTNREVGTIIRSLGCYPSEAELHDMIQEVEEDEPTGFIRLEKFQPMMARVMIERRCVSMFIVRIVQHFSNNIVQVKRYLV